SNWTSPNEQYEEAAKAFAKGLLNEDSDFMKSFSGFHRKVADFGIINSLSQLLLKFTCPGVPDVYQGTELWDLSLVDPDNRRPVDYSKRAKLLDEIDAGSADDLLQLLWDRRNEGLIKLWMTRVLLQERNASAPVFEEGNYLPLRTEGSYKDNIVAFARRQGGTWYITIVPLHLAAICKAQGTTLEAIDWKNTRIVLPEDLPGSYTCLFSKANGKAKGALAVREILSRLPLELLKLEDPASERGAGILLAISSLPAAFGIGDMGPEAYAFADFLSRGRQKYWQILPLNPTEQAAGHSPYSSYSSMGGNPLLISPELLKKDGLITEDELLSHRREASETADYAAATAIRESMFEIAFNRFDSGSSITLKQEYDRFCAAESMIQCINYL
ncbi:MAG: 4-alpha-glucanotransferase, partial [Sphingobacteriales bacterium]